MQLVITAPKTESVAAFATEIEWVTKGGSSVVSKDGRWAVRKNSKGEWRAFDITVSNTTPITVAPGKEQAKMAAQGRLDSESAPATDLKDALRKGDAKVYSVRGNGTTRRRHFLTGDDLKAAQAVQAMRNDGKGLAFIAGELHVSISNVRRMLVDLALTEELEAMQNDELAAMLKGAEEA